MCADAVSEWWLLSRAETETGYRPETVRKWATSGRVRYRKGQAGRRSYYEVAASDVRREADRNAKLGRTPTNRAKPMPTTPRFVNEDDGNIRGRVASLEEVARRYRHIEELRDQVAELQLQIGREHREIEVILMGPSTVPDA